MENPPYTRKQCPRHNPQTLTAFRGGQHVSGGDRREKCSVSPRMKSVTSESRCLGSWVLPCQQGAPHRWQVDRRCHFCGNLLTEVYYTRGPLRRQAQDRGLSGPSPRGMSGPRHHCPARGLLSPEIHHSSHRVFRPRDDDMCSSSTVRRAWLGFHVSLTHQKSCFFLLQ